MLSNKSYDILKVIALLVLPIAEFITALGNIWNLPYITQIVSTLVALDALLGVLLKISCDKYAQANYTLPEQEIDESEAVG